jgi:hypothetical protein
VATLLGAAAAPSAVEAGVALGRSFLRDDRGARIGAGTGEVERSAASTPAEASCTLCSANVLLVTREITETPRRDPHPPGELPHTPETFMVTTSGPRSLQIADLRT